MSQSSVDEDMESLPTVLRRPVKQEILRVIYPLNKSGSMQITFALDASEGFMCVFRIGRPGRSGFELLPGCLKVLRNHEECINQYFNGASKPQGTLQPSSSIYNIHFRRNFGKPMIVILDTDFSDYDDLWLGKSSWNGLRSLFPMISQMFETYENWAYDALRVCVAFSKHMKHRLAQDVFSPGTVLENTPQFQIAYDSTLLSHLKLGNEIMSNIDLDRCFNEIKAFCAEYIVYYMSSL